MAAQFLLRSVDETNLLPINQQPNGNVSLAKQTLKLCLRACLPVARVAVINRIEVSSLGEDFDEENPLAAIPGDLKLPQRIGGSQGFAVVGQGHFERFGERL